MHEESKAYLGDPNMHRSESDIFQLVVMKDIDDKRKQVSKQGYVPNSIMQPLYKNQKELAQQFQLSKVNLRNKLKTTYRSYSKAKHRKAMSPTRKASIHNELRNLIMRQEQLKQSTPMDHNVFDVSNNSSLNTVSNLT